MRPSILIAPLPSTYNDWLICMLSSKIASVSRIFDIISPDDPDFGSSGLKTETVIRWTRLAVVNESVISGTIGEISIERLERLKESVAGWIVSS